MIVNFAKSLDRPVDIFGVKGRWLVIFLAFTGVSVVAAVIMGMAISSGTGIATAIVLVAVSFVMCLVLQGRTSHRQLSKTRASGSIPAYLSRRETVCSVLVRDPRWDEAVEKDGGLDAGMKEYHNKEIKK